MAKKIVVYKCPFYDECQGSGMTYYAADSGEPYIIPECKGALFEDEQGDAVCAISSAADQGHYKKVIKEVQRRYFRRPSIIMRLKNWIKKKR